jgi:hypothetical protein
MWLEPNLPAHMPQAHPVAAADLAGKTQRQIESKHAGVTDRIES